MLFQNTWVVESLLGNKLDISKFTRGLPSLNFGRDGNLSGFTGCNQMHGSFEADKKGLKFGNIASTKMYCEGVDEDSFTNALGKVTNFQKDGNKLNLLGGKDVLMTLIPQ
jgi:heat shock protein HslJ